MQKFAQIHLKAETRARYGLPDIAYPVPMDVLMSGLEHDGELPLAEMLLALQERCSEAKAPWEQLEPAMDRLAALLSPEDPREVISAAGDDWWLEVGPVDLNGRFVSLQREQVLLAAIAPRSDGRLRVAVYRPLDATCARLLFALGRVPHPQHGVVMRENNWEYALDCSAHMGQVYASMNGEAYLSRWDKGLGISHDDTALPEWRAQLRVVPRPAVRAVTELGVYYALHDEPGDATPPNTRSEPPPPSRPVIPAWSGKKQQQRTVRSRFLGCLLGGAVGDALGAPVEFMRRAEIRRQFGPGGIKEYAPAYGGLGTITDDTQMTLFTAEGLLRGWVRGCTKGITDYASTTAYAYVRWLQTQGERPANLAGFKNSEPGWLASQPALHSRRAPGNTCLSALRDMRSAGMPATNDSKGCGGVMRVAPVGLFAWRLRKRMSVQDAFELGTCLAGLTHGHATGSLTGGVLAVLVMALVDGGTLQSALTTAKALLREADGHQETLRALEQAEALAASGRPPADAIAELGEAWVAEEALAISVYCALVARNFRHGVTLAVNHDGDSDSTGAIVGNLLGAMHGAKVIPASWLEPLELREVITEMAEDLFAFPDWEMTDQLWEKYPGC